MRVLLCTPDFPPRAGGIQLLLRKLVEHSRHRVRVVTVAAPPNRSEPDVDIRRANHVLPGHRAEMVALNLEVLRQARAWRPDAVICGHIVVAPAALAAQTHLDVPVVQYLYSDELRGRPRLARFALRRATVSIAISAHTQTQAVTLGADPDRIHMIPPGVDLSDLGTPGSMPSKFAEPTIITVSRMNEVYKGFDVMLRALPLVRARIPGARWIAIGDGVLRDCLLETATAWGLKEACVFPGRVSDSERDALLARSHVFALPTRITSANGGGEGFGIVYLEAGAHLLPCVAGAGSGGAEAVKHGETGLIVDPYDHVAVAGALVQLMSDPARAAEMGRSGRRRAEEHSWTRMATEVDAVLNSLGDGRPR
jgi:phosphatidyl-myo-inositol dimannoside synthase